MIDPRKHHCSGCRDELPNSAGSYCHQCSMATCEACGADVESRHDLDEGGRCEGCREWREQAYAVADAIGYSDSSDEQELNELIDDNNSTQELVSRWIANWLVRKPETDDERNRVLWVKELANGLSPERRAA